MNRLGFLRLYVLIESSFLAFVLSQSFLNLLQFSRFLFETRAGQECSVTALAEVLPWTCVIPREL